MPANYPSHIDIRKTTTAGFGTFTSKEISAGQLIFKVERPLVVVLDFPRLSDTCEWCLKNVQDGTDGGRSLKACTGCKVVRYCSKVGVRLSPIYSMIVCYGLGEKYELWSALNTRTSTVQFSLIRYMSSTIRIIQFITAVEEKMQAWVPF